LISSSTIGYALRAITFFAFTLHILTEDVMTSKYHKNGKTLKALVVNHNRNSRERFRRGIKKVDVMKKQVLAGSGNSPTSGDKNHVLKLISWRAC